MYYAFLQRQSKEWLLLRSYSSEKQDTLKGYSLYYAFLQRQSKEWLLLRSYSSEKHVVRSLQIEKKNKTKQRTIKVTLGLSQS